MWKPTSARRRYLAILDYLPADAPRTVLIEELRGALRRRTGLATTHGVGPGYYRIPPASSTKADRIPVFVLLTAADATATPVPTLPCTFSTLKFAQALGDFDALVANGREVVHYHLDDPSTDFGVFLERLLAKIGER